MGSFQKNMDERSSQDTAPRPFGNHNLRYCAVHVDTIYWNHLFIRGGNMRTYSVCGKTVAVFPCDIPGAPVVYLNTGSEDPR